MDELGAILGVWREKRHASGVLATIVHVEGSAYRRPGARMFIGSDGTTIGTISGGCLEGDVTRKAAWWTASGQAVVRTYDTRSDDDAVFEFGLGCNGVIHLLLEPMESPAAQELLALLDAARSAFQPAVVATLTHCTHAESRVGDRVYWGPAGDWGGALATAPSVAQLQPHAEAALAECKSRYVHLPDGDFFVEFVAPPQKLIIFGAGHDAIPLAQMAKTLGWDVTVADGRRAYAAPERFPTASTVLLPASADISELVITSDVAIVLMTHSYPLDKLLLPQLLKARPRYIGMLGPKSRAERLLRETNLWTADANLNYPAGLDIGADNPVAIAISILAEIQAAISQRPGMPLRFRTEPIHQPAQTIGERGHLQETVAPACEVSA